MLVTPLGSGSAGNSYFFESDGTRILVDAGFGPRETDRRLQAIGRSLCDIHAIVLTHEHYDHLRGAPIIGRKFQIPIYLTEGTLNASGMDPEEVPVVVFENNGSFRIGELMVHARRTLHDAQDPSCYVIESRDGTRVGIASDLGCVDQPVLRHLSNCDGLFFESNHDLDMLRAGSYPWSLKRRIMSPFGHLSNDDSMLALRRMLGPESKSVCLIHLSERNNHESIVRSMAETVIGRTGAPIDLQIARQRDPLPVLDIVKRRPVTQPVPLMGQMALF
jgi:phosphoribosyl 1,2-cyclic phosphodiesterase